MIKWGPTGEAVYRRTYSRTLPDGTKETWPLTVERVVDGNVRLAPDYNPFKYAKESDQLYSLISDFKLLPAGRHLWASGVEGRQFLFNCWVSGWYENVSDHFRFTLMRLAEGGGVGANYSSKYLDRYGPIKLPTEVHIVCDPMHRDYEAMKAAGLLSDYYSPDYTGSYFEVEDSREGWADALADLIEAAWDEDASPVRVYDVSRVRCKGSRIKGFGGTASGPEPLAKMLRDVGATLTTLAIGFTDFDGRYLLTLDPLTAMEIDHAIGECVVAGGVRRSARMSILPWDDPWIMDFLDCKADPSKHWTTNISVAVDDRFFAQLDAGDVHADGVLGGIASRMLANGEPGVWNYSLSQAGEVDEIIATNPCGEIPLTGFGEPCNLGHVNLDAFASGGVFDLPGAVEAAKLMTRFLIRATHGDVTDPRSRAILDRNRRIGVGLVGYQAAFAKLGIRFSETHSHPYVKHVLTALQRAVRREARRYASELRIPEPIKVTTVAPTGTVAKLSGTTEGIHPVYARHFIRRIRFSTVDADERAQLDEYRQAGYKVEADMYAENTAVVEIPTLDPLVAQVEALGYPAEVVESADEISVEDMLKVQATVQELFADNAVSFTVNVPAGSITPDELAKLLRVYLPRLKGTTVMVDESRPQAPYERLSRDQYETLTGPKAVADSIDEECASGACPIR
ncbi:ribonucleoside-triphosphate reductase, adenosylcobalamin-dependent [Nonomuraea roseoviolacea subsp. roseoviolacea]|uniref:ribonucleoside-triphosphate reductase, adenosylcobalamin-dependent n=1 Tax=Nonomuraea roseoviolacea TaxID=103837 RepID=UPI0031D63F08